MGIANNVLEDLEVLTLGELTFTLPNNLNELQEQLGLFLYNCCYACFEYVFVC